MISAETSQQKYSIRNSYTTKAFTRKVLSIEFFLRFFPRESILSRFLFVSRKSVFSISLSPTNVFPVNLSRVDSVLNRISSHKNDINWFPTMEEYFHQYSFQRNVFSLFPEHVLSILLFPWNAFSKHNFFKKIFSNELFRRQSYISRILSRQSIINKTLSAVNVFSSELSFQE